LTRVIPCAFVLALALLLASLAGAARAGSTGLVVSQVYGGGGNSGATYQNDYVEVLNTGTSAVDLSGWTLQYATAAGASWQPVALAGTVPARRYYLVQLASGGTAGAALPAPDATGSVNLAATGGKLALVHGTTALTCGATAGSCGSSSAEDLVGYGSATDYEGAGAAPALDATHAAVRAAGGCTDSGDNAADFASAAPTPRTSTSPAATCSSGGGGTTAGPSASATVSADVQPGVTISLDQPAPALGAITQGGQLPRVPEHVTVVSNLGAGYALTVHRSAFTPADLPLGIAAAAPAGAALGALLQGGALAPVPVAPAADLVVGTTAAPSVAGGDVWSTQLGLIAPLPSVPPGRYQATVAFTVVAR
jgi:Lamin Tail Domain